MCGYEVLLQITIVFEALATHRTLVRKLFGMYIVDVIITDVFSEELSVTIFALVAGFLRVVDLLVNGYVITANSAYFTQFLRYLMLVFEMFLYFAGQRFLSTTFATIQ